MHLYEQLQAATKADREYLLAAPAIQQALQGAITRELYVEFLTQAYHHVRHTVPLLMAVGSRLPEQHDWLREAVLHYLDEEKGHEQWILNDIEHAGGDRAAAAASQPAIATEAMVAYAYDTVMRRNPLGFFGMVYVLEGTSVALALHAADRIQAALRLPAQAFSYLRSHGELDKEHVGDLENILGRFTAGSRSGRGDPLRARDILALRQHVPRARACSECAVFERGARADGMKAADMRVLLTGASGGIGRALAAELHGRGASVMLVGRDVRTLAQLLGELGGESERLQACVADLSTRVRPARGCRTRGGLALQRAAQQRRAGRVPLHRRADGRGPRAAVRRQRAGADAAHAHAAAVPAQPAPGRRPEHRLGLRQPGVSRDSPPIRRASSRCAASPRRCGVSWPTPMSRCSTWRRVPRAPA